MPSHKDGRISVQVVNDDLDDKAIVKAAVFLSAEDPSQVATKRARIRARDQR